MSGSIRAYRIPVAVGLTTPNPGQLPKIFCYELRVARSVPASADHKGRLQSSPWTSLFRGSCAPVSSADASERLLQPN